MRPIPLFIPAILAIVIFHPSAAESAPSAPKGYIRTPDGCLHRTPASVLKGLPQIKCDAPGGGPPAGPPPAYTTASPIQVIAALDCDFSVAARATKGKPFDISKALITGKITFSLVTKKSSGASLSVAAIPVFSGASLAPSWDASRVTETTTSDEWTIKIDPSAVSTCPGSGNNWLTSKALLAQVPPPGPVRVEKFDTKISFVVTTQSSAGLKLAISPVSIGPNFAASTSHTQSLSLTFDFTKKEDGTPPAAPLVPPAH